MNIVTMSYRHDFKVGDIVILYDHKNIWGRIKDVISNPKITYVAEVLDEKTFYVEHRPPGVMEWIYLLRKVFIV